MRHIELVNQQKNTKVGNHRIEFYENNSIGHCYYYSTVIVKIDYANWEFAIIDRKISTSTSCACGKYRNYLTSQGYEQVEWGKI